MNKSSKKQSQASATLGTEQSMTQLGDGIAIEGGSVHGNQEITVNRHGVTAEEVGDLMTQMGEMADSAMGYQAKSQQALQNIAQTSVAAQTSTERMVERLTGPLVLVVLGIAALSFFRRKRK
ncbi:hypothetical protein KS4_16140 [Poriferisphaera corsica]|uniref:Uncharacterized protein n=1 Tax=Poriferisphaera corsica TaxID=2528020 RepID=A0A517YTK1_9BACT|nr:hypothetical protein [Poriferisphaera corsica]QDU33563.1 hypothetical protein KS4_16140 [Poriferisphaera corsica]